MDVGFVGLGVMGRGMAGCLLRAGHRVTVYNRTPGPEKALVSLGAQAARSPAEVARNSRVVCVCVTDGAAVRQVLDGPEGILAGASPGTVVVDHSTIAPEEARALRDLCASRGVRFLDAPVTGGDVGAREGTLTIMVGGDEEAYREVLPVLQAMGRHIEHVGGSGQGQLLKLINNLVGGIALVAAAEGLALGLAGGLTLEKMMSVLSRGSAQSVSLSLMGERLRTGERQPGFAVKHRMKDFDLALQAARTLRVPLPAGALAAELMRRLLADGKGDLDQSAYLDLLIPGETRPPREA